MFGDRTKGSLLHDSKIVQANSRRPRKGGVSWKYNRQTEWVTPFDYLIQIE